MIIINFNIYSLIIFTIIILLSFFVLYIYFKEYKKTLNKYRFLSVVFLIISFLILSSAVFGINLLKNESDNFVGTNVVFVLDVSKSMNALDFSENGELYSRLGASKKFINEFVTNNPGNRYALEVFAGDSTRVLPFTSDIDLFMTILSGVDENNVSKQGTNLKEAIKEGLKNFIDEDNYGLMVLISDGGEENDMKLNEFKNKDIGKEIRLFLVGVGSKIGSYIPIGQDPFGQVIYKTYNGTKVLTRLNESNLINITKNFKGDYFYLEKISNLYSLSGILNKVAKKSFFSKVENFVDLTRIITLFSFFFFVIYLVFLVKYESKK